MSAQKILSANVHHAEKPVLADGLCICYIDSMNEAEKAAKSEVSKREEEVLAFWNERQIFEKSLAKDAPKGEFVFYDGPPFATGLPHYGHLLQSAIKDAIPRYKTMQGYRVPRQWGWDCHGLPIENIVEKEIGSKSKKDILAMGVKKFNDLCREQIFTFIKDWERIIPRLGRWADMAHPYRTMDFEYMQSEWWAFKTLHEKGLVYEDYRSMHICPRCETTLSQGEVAEGYKDVKDLSVTVKFKVKEPAKHGLPEHTYLLAWTTTPWTLPGNVALAVGADIEYVTIEKKDEGIGGLVRFVLAKDLLEHLFAGQEYTIIKTQKGSELVGIEYEPLFTEYATDETLKNRENGWKVYAADFVTTDTGTGIVHIAPAFGADDMALAKEKRLPFVQHVKMDGTFVERMGEFAGLDLKPRAKDKPEEIREADLTMVKYLEKEGKVFAYEKYEHSYPHCWRCDTALLNYATSSWFVAVEKIKPELLEYAKSINWSPAHIKEGRWGEWLRGARDWSISRQRFWANTIPVWRCDACKKDHVFGSAAELNEASGVMAHDLHKDAVDDVSFACDCGGMAKRVPDVLDTWFDSGSVPFAARGGEFIPADFIAEGQDQTRAWFYYQHVLAGALFDSPAFKNCAVTGIVLAEDGKKMAKKLKNYPDPMEVIEKYGADAMRLYMLSSPVVRAESLSFSEKDVADLSRKVFGRLANVYEFYALYAQADTSDQLSALSSAHVLDRWILARLRHVHRQVTDGLDAYALDEATRPLNQFVDDLSTWYLRRSRERIKGDDADDMHRALATTAYVLAETAKLLAPFSPFFAEWLWRQLRTEGDAESVHLAAWSESHELSDDDRAVLADMQEVRNVVSLALEQRAKAGIPVRQPLGSMNLISGGTLWSDDLIALVLDEVNIKNLMRVGGVSEVFVVELDTTLTPELQEEGIVREVVRAIQAARKEAQLTPGQRTTVAVASHDAAIIAALEKHRDAIMSVTNLEKLTAHTGDERIKVVLGE